MQRVLAEAYEQASRRQGPGQGALMEALSVYNTGNPTNGLRNGYVGSVYRIKLPKIDAARVVAPNGPR
jgi:type IV secretion system protein VirB1